MTSSPTSESPGSDSASLAPVSAGFVCVLAGFASSYAIVVAAAQAMGMSRDQLVTMTLAGIGSAFWAVLLGLALRLILRGWR